jgi:hypothetical protein
MKKIAAVILIACLMQVAAISQGIGINSKLKAADTSAILDVSSTEKGILIPRLSTLERNGITKPATALLIFNTDLKQFQVNVGTPLQPGWQSILTLSVQQPSKDVWQTGGNKFVSDSAYVGNADQKPLYFKTNNLVRLSIDSSANRVGIATTKPRSSLDINTTDAIIVPVGTTEQRPPLPVVGMIRYNATLNKLEGYTSSGWVALH